MPDDRRVVPVSDVDWERVARFASLLVLLAIVYRGATYAAGIDPVLLAPVYMFSPAVAALAVCVLTDVPLGQLGFRFERPGWLAAAAVLPLALVGLAIGLALAVPGIAFDPTVDLFPGIPLPSGPLGVVAGIALVLGLGATVNTFLALGEEVGWRGYLLWELAPLGFWRASLLIGVLWGLWHAPVIVAGYNYPSFPLVGVAAMTVATTAFSPVYTYLVVRSKSVLAAALFHGVFNASAGALALAVANDVVLDELVANAVGAAGIVAFLLATLAVAVLDEPTLDRDAAAWAGSSESATE